MRVLTKDDLLSVKPKCEPVAVPELGEDAQVYVRTMTGWERSALEKQFAEKKPTDDPGGFRGAILVRALVDGEGTRLFADDDLDSLMALPAGMLERLFEAACALNGFTTKDVDALEKN